MLYSGAVKGWYYLSTGRLGDPFVAIRARDKYELAEVVTEIYGSTKGVYFTAAKRVRR